MFQKMLERCVSQNFMDKRHLEMWSMVKDPTEVLPKIKNTDDWDGTSFNDPRSAKSKRFPTNDPWY